MTALLFLFVGIVSLVQSETISDIKDRFRSQIKADNDWAFYGIALSETNHDDASPVLALTVGVHDMNQTVTWPIELETGIYATLPKQVIHVEPPSRLSQSSNQLRKQLNKKHHAHAHTQLAKQQVKLPTVAVGSAIAPAEDPENVGTAGFFVTKGGHQFLVTNHHVVDKGETATLGDARIGKSIFAVDTTQSREAKLHVDMSIIPVDLEAVEVSCSPPDNQFVPHDDRMKWDSVKWSLVFEAEHLIGKKVTAYGSETQRQFGVISAFGELEYSHKGFPITIFNQLLIKSDGDENFGAHGDSGKVVVLAEAHDEQEEKDASAVAEGQIVGLFWGGGITAYYASPMSDVATVLEKELQGEFTIC